MGGPWFTVQKSGSGWRTLDTLWLSDGAADVKGRVEIRVGFEEMAHDS